MKIRHGFVSNSSSSSFIVIDREGQYDIPEVEDPYVIGEAGETQFGWGPEYIDDFHSRVNFAYIQAEYSKKDEWKSMLTNVLVETLGISTVTSKIGLDSYGEGEVYGYIDHQSSAEEGANTELFDSEEVLKDFLFGEGSYIQLNNDNEGW